MSRVLRVGIVDDERLARERLHALLVDDAGVQVALTCADGDTAVEQIVRERPDLVFLDVQMPGRDGFAVVEAVLAKLGDAAPFVIFVTAYDEHAIRAFDAQAVDYLVKPFDDDRFASAMQRARKRLRQERLEAASGHLRALLDAIPAASDSEPATAAPESEAETLDRFALKVRDRTRFVRAETVDWIEADGVYARLHIARESYLIRIPMHDLERRLDARRFVRIHRSTIVNLDRVKEVQELFRGELALMLEDGTQLKLSRSRRAHLEKLLGQRL
jgi:two-component system LytT family response regulator